jgi:phosphoribosylformylglycinamidine synthase
VSVAVVVFPGSNCDHDSLYAVEQVCGVPAHAVWHRDSDLGRCDAVIVPGGFSYGDYLRTGAIARFSPVMAAVRTFAEQGGPVLGICNGFQILQECALLPGAMLRNRGVHFLSRDVHVRIEHADTAATAGLRAGDVLRLPIAHGEGNFYLPDDELARLEDQGQVVFRYTTADGALEPAANPNGSARAVAGVCNAARNVVGLMPHPERACEVALGSDDGRRLLEAFLRA